MKSDEYSANIFILSDSQKYFLIIIIIHHVLNDEITRLTGDLYGEIWIWYDASATIG